MQYTSRFPRLNSRGPIEAGYTQTRLASGRLGFPRLNSRGPIEAIVQSASANVF